MVSSLFTGVLTAIVGVPVSRAGRRLELNRNPVDSRLKGISLGAIVQVCRAKCGARNSPEELLRRNTRRCEESEKGLNSLLLLAFWGVESTC